MPALTVVALQCQHGELCSSLLTSDRSLHAGAKSSLCATCWGLCQPRAVHVCAKHVKVVVAGRGRRAASGAEKAHRCCGKLAECCNIPSSWPPSPPELWEHAGWDPCCLQCSSPSKGKVGSAFWLQLKAKMKIQCEYMKCMYVSAHCIPLLHWAPLQSCILTSGARLGGAAPGAPQLLSCFPVLSVEPLPGRACRGSKGTVPADLWTI